MLQVSLYNQPNFSYEKGEGSRTPSTPWTAYVILIGGIERSFLFSYLSLLKDDVPLSPHFVYITWLAWYTHNRQGLTIDI